MGRLVYGGVEGGGTKFNCMIATGPDDVVAMDRFPTAGAAETMDSVIRFFQANIGDNTLAAVGIASFGPVDLNPSSPRFGFITTTPKPGWQMVDIAGTVRERLGVPVGFDTDVNAAALGEYRWGAAQGADPVVYITVGTGIGGGGYVNGKPLHGLIHPEMGHLLLPQIPGDDFTGICPYHGRCLEGMASGPALGARTGKPAKDLAPDDPVWELEARYLALALANITYVLSPRRVVLGGGVMEQRQLFPRIQQHVLALTNSYLRHPAVQEDIASYIVPPGLGARCGMLGAVELARLAASAATTGA
jgi:fructokinase